MDGQARISEVVRLLRSGNISEAEARERLRPFAQELVVERRLDELLEEARVRRISPRHVAALGVVVFMLVLVPSLISESVTLTTYYPAPSGVYTQMITTGDTYLSRDSGKSLIGTSSPTGTAIASEKLIVNGDIRLNGASAAYRIANVANPVNPQDVATRAYVLSQAGGGGPTTWNCHLEQYGPSSMHYDVRSCATGRLIGGGCTSTNHTPVNSAFGAADQWMCQVDNDIGQHVYLSLLCCQ